MKLFFIAITTFCSIGAGLAQQLPIGSLYYANMLSINPAYVGYKSKMELFVGHRNQFVGFENAPKTNFLSLAGRVANNHRVGLTVFSDATALFTKNIIQGNYGYSLQFGSQQQLVFGLGAGLSTLDLNLGGSKAVDMNDQVYTTVRQTKAGFNADFGVLYELKNLQVGFSIPQLFNNAVNFELENNKMYTYKNTSHMRGTVKYDFSLKKSGLLTASPIVMVRSVKGAPLQYDISAIVDHQNWGWFGITYHSEFAVAASLGFRYKNFTIGYAHDFIMGDLQRFGKYSSEIVLGYTFEKRKVTQPKQDLTNILDPKAVEKDEAATEAPTDKELELMRQEIEKKRKEKMMQNDSIQKANAAQKELELIKESENIAKSNEEKQVNETTKEPEGIKEEKEETVTLSENTSENKTETEDEFAVVTTNKEKEAETKEKDPVTEPNINSNNQDNSTPTTQENSDNREVEKSTTTTEMVNPTKVETKVEEPKDIIVSETDETRSTEGKTQLVFDDATNFSLEDGEKPDEGFYIILGAFSDHNNTVRFMKTLRMNGIDDAFIVKNEVKNLEQVCVFYTGQIGDARNELMGYRQEGRKSWILNLK